MRPIENLDEFCRNASSQFPANASHGACSRKTIDLITRGDFGTLESEQCRERTRGGGPTIGAACRERIERQTGSLRQNTWRFHTVEYQGWSRRALRIRLGSVRRFVPVP